MVEQASSDWIKCDGTGYPGSYLVRLQVQFRAGRDRESAERSAGREGNTAYFYSDSWTYSATSESPGDIVACRVVA